MRKVLFIIPGLEHGGTNRSMKNLLGRMDYNDIQIEILSLCSSGIYYNDFEKHLQKEIQPITEALLTFGRRRSYESILSYLQRLWWKFVYIGFFKRSNDKIYTLLGRRLQKMNYDVVIAFQEGIATDVGAHISAHTHIAWVRCDYANYVQKKPCFKSEEALYSKYDKVICVSQYTARVFGEFYPGLHERILPIYNMIDTDSIVKLANSEIDDECFLKANMTLVSIGRFAPEKRFTAIPAIAGCLKKAGILFKWYIIGDGGTEKSKIVEKIQENNVQDCLILLGAKKNPYPYIAQSDILVCPSYTEACPNVVNEAKILHVPVVAADFPSAYEFITHGENGFIVPVEEMANLLIDLCEKKEMLKKVKDGISGFVYDNHQIEKQIHELIMRD